MLWEYIVLKSININLKLYNKNNDYIFNKNICTYMTKICKYCIPFTMFYTSQKSWASLYPGLFT